MQKSLYYIKLLLLVLCIGGAVSACKKSDDEKDSAKPELTILFHQPLSGLEYYLNKDLQEVNNALLNNPELSKKVNILYFRNDELVGKLYQKVLQQDPKTGELSVEDVEKKVYSLSQLDYTATSGLHQILSDVMSIGKTEKYGMVIGCHANGWIPTDEDKSSRANNNNIAEKRITKRTFGKTNIDKYSTTYKTLGKAIEKTGKKLEFVLIDDCNSQNIEVAYDLRNACHYLIGSVTEIGANGMQYETTVPYLIAANYRAICDDTYAYYTAPDNSWGTATISVVDCSQTEQMALIMKEIYKKAGDVSVDRSSIQVLDGYDYPLANLGYNIFYDFADYVRNLCTDANLLSQFNAQLSKLVVYNVYTPKFNSCFFDNFDEEGYPYLRPLTSCCGISCSDLCSEKRTEWQQTAWYIATH